MVGLDWVRLGFYNEISVAVDEKKKKGIAKGAIKNSVLFPQSVFLFIKQILHCAYYYMYI